MVPQPEVGAQLVFVCRGRAPRGCAQREKPLGVGMQAADFIQVTLRFGADGHAVAMAAVLVERFRIEAEAAIAQQ